MPKPDDATVVVVGGGLAGVRMCEELRKQGFTGAVHLVSADTGPPCDRPPLSKGSDGVDRSVLRIDLDQLDVRVHTGVRATGLRGAGVSATLDVLLADDALDHLDADAVVVATGATPIVPAGWPTDSAIHVLRSRDDAVRLWAAVSELPPAARIAVIGGSWIGLEFASVARGLGPGVTVFERSAWLLPALPPEAGRVIKHWCEAAGVGVRLGETVDSLAVSDGPGGVTVATAQSSETFDLVLVALGVSPDTQWLRDAGLHLGPTGALKVDAHLRANDPRIVGVGDAVERWSPRYQHTLPGGHWQDARDEPVVAAGSVLAAVRGATAVSELGQPYDAVPYFWSEMFGHTIQFSGYVADYRVAQMVVRGDLSDPSWTVCWIDGESRLQAVLSCDRPRDAITARKALTADSAGLPGVDPVALADPEVPLADSLVDAPARTAPARTAPARTAPARTPPARTPPARTPPAGSPPAGSPATRAPGEH